MTLYLFKMHLQTFLSIPITQKCQIFVTFLLQMSDIILHRNLVTNAKVLPCCFTEKELSGIASRKVSVAFYKLILNTIFRSRSEKRASLQGPTNKRMALDGKPGARTLILLSDVWTAEPRTIDCRGEQLAYRVIKPSVSTCIDICHTVGGRLDLSSCLAEPCELVVLTSPVSANVRI